LSASSWRRTITTSRK
jgi:hypothetical protein